MKIIYLILLLIVPFLSNGTTNLKVGDKAPDFTISDPNGVPINLYALQGKIILLDFWASWCGPCRIANKDLVRISKDYKDKDVEIFSISLDSDKSKWINAIEKDKLTWPFHGSDLNDWNSKAAQLYSIVALPTTFLIDENGIIVAKSHSLYQIQLSLNELIFKNSIPYPVNTAEKIFLSEKMKYEILNTENKSTLKGKDQFIDVTSLPAGPYTLQLDHMTFKFNKINPKPLPFQFDTINGNLIVTEPSLVEIYNQRGKLIKEINGSKVDISDLKWGNYFININGTISKYTRELNYPAAK